MHNALTLYFSPLACSVATRAILYETETPARFVDRKDVADYARIHPLKQVPALELPDGEVLTENAAVLQHVGEQLTPKDARGRREVQRWLSFVSSELHKAVFAPTFDPAAPAEVKAYALAKAEAPLVCVARHLSDGRRYLLGDELCVADAYLAAILTWTAATPIDLGRWPVLKTYLKGLMERPAFGRAFSEEREEWVKRNPELAKAIAQRR